MEITLIQGLLLLALGIIVGMDEWLEGFFIFRPIITATITGFILGDVQTGIVAGGLTELIFAGLTPAGGTKPPNPVLAGIMTPVIAYTSSISPQTAIGLALPFSFVMQYLLLFYYSIFSVFMSKADSYAENLNIRAFSRLNVYLTLFVGLSNGIVVFLSAYLIQSPMQSLVESMPEWLTHGFEITGDILPAVGFALLLGTMMRKELIPFFIVGFALAALTSFENLLPVALVGTAIALYEYFYGSNNKNSSEVASDGGDNNDGI